MRRVINSFLRGAEILTEAAKEFVEPIAQEKTKRQLGSVALQKNIAPNEESEPDTQYISEVAALYMEAGTIEESLKAKHIMMELNSYNLTPTEALQKLQNMHPKE